MKPGDIIYIDFQHASFKWANGLKIVIKINVRNNELHICDIDDRGNPSLFDDGRYMCGVTGINNLGIRKTKLRYKLEKNPKHN